MHPFRITIIFNGQRYRYSVQQMQGDENEELYNVHTKSKIITLVNNRPLWARKGFPGRSPTWKVKYGQVKYPRWVELVVEQIEMVRKGREG